jgi:hypothetical protein
VRRGQLQGEETKARPSGLADEDMNGVPRIPSTRDPLPNNNPPIRLAPADTNQPMMNRTHPLSPTNHHLSILLDDLGSQIRRIRTSHAKLGHGKRAPNLSVQEGKEVFLLLSRVGVTSEDFHVACIRGGAVGCLRADEGGVTHDFGHNGVLQEGQERQEIVRISVRFEHGNVIIVFHDSLQGWSNPLRAQGNATCSRTSSIDPSPWPSSSTLP